jgi:hypothetical protein
MKFLKSVWNDIPIALNLGFVVSLASAFLMEFWWSHIPEFFDGGYKIGQVMENILLSIVSGYVFYFIVNFLPKKKEKNLNKFLLNDRIHNITIHYSYFLSYMNDQIQMNIDDKYSVDLISKLFDTYIGKIAAKENEYSSNALFLETTILSSSTRKEIERIYQYSPLLDSELRVLISRIESDMFLNNVDFINVNFQDRNFEDILPRLKTIFLYYINSLLKLEDYRNKINQ